MKSIFAVVWVLLFCTPADLLLAGEAEAATIPLVDNPFNDVADGPLNTFFGVDGDTYVFQYTFDDYIPDQKYEWMFTFQNIDSRRLTFAADTSFMHSNNAGELIFHFGDGKRVFELGEVFTASIGAINPSPNKYGQPVSLYLQVYAIPLPAGLSLLASAVLGLWGIARLGHRTRHREIAA